MAGIKKPTQKGGMGKGGTGKLTKTSKKGSVELKEADLGKVTGGSFSFGAKQK